MGIKIAFFGGTPKESKIKIENHEKNRIGRQRSFIDDLSLCVGFQA
jgi:hypothetical protein